MKKMTESKLEEKISSGERITIDEAEHLFEWDVLTLGRLADKRRALQFAGKEVGFIIDRIINYTNICDARCSFCAFHAKADRVPAYELSMDEILDKVAELDTVGGSQVMLQGGLHPDNSLEKFLLMVKGIKTKFPHIFLHSFSPSEIVHVAKKEGLSVHDVIASLHKAGLDSIPGASDLLVQRIRAAVSPNKATVKEWQEVMRTLAALGMKSSATMTYGLGETNGEKIQHLAVIRDIQDETGVIRAFIPWSFSAAHTKLSELPPSTGVDYLKIVAIGRVFLDNVKYIQAGWLTEGLKLAQLALAMGANDMGGILMEETVVKATGITTSVNIEMMAEIIRNAGKIPVLRDSSYATVKPIA